MSKEPSNEFIQRFEKFNQELNDYPLAELVTPLFTGYVFIKISSIIFKRVQFTNSSIGILLTFSIQAFLIAILLVYLQRAVRIGQKVYERYWSKLTELENKPFTRSVSQTVDECSSSIRLRAKNIEGNELMVLRPVFLHSVIAASLQVVLFIILVFSRSIGILSDAIGTYSSSSTALPYIFAVFNPFLAVFIYITGNLSDSPEVSFYILLLVVFPALWYSLGISRAIFYIEYLVHRAFLALFGSLSSQPKNSEVGICACYIGIMVILETCSWLL